MNQCQQKQMDNFRTDYATSADFCQVFEIDTDQLYLLAFLLMANHKDAERCFVSTVDAVFNEHAVFKGWARTWIKRTLIKHAIQIASPLSDRGTATRDLWSDAQHGKPGDFEIDAVTRLAPLERFIFVMSVLERYASWECSVLLGCDTNKVIQVRARALREVAGRDVPLKRVERSKPNEMAQAIVFLGSDQASFITGATITAGVGKSAP